MGKYYYQKSKGIKLKKILRLTSIVFIIIGISTISYVLFPIVSWQIYFQPAFASQNITPSIPRANIVDLARSSLDRTDYTKPENWFPKFNPIATSGQVPIPSYTISIPKINLENTEVSTIDNDLTQHLVNYSGTGIPAKNGNAVIFGHSTLPQLFNPKDYKTIFANVYKLKNGDDIYALIKGVKYSYKIFKITIVDPSDSSALEQNYDNSYLTLVTCTPPGTIWKRLIVKARLEKI
ncbi:MAG: sortase [Candidatus Parcubacteria bacterium]|nr:sortase [Candidatus Parcubacteria bacterium]